MSEDKKLQQQVAELTEELVAAKTRAEENLAGWQRAKADYLNLKKEQAGHATEIMAWANAALMSEILPVYNHFKLALSHIPEEQKKEPWVEGIVMIQKQFVDFLNKYQLTEIKTVGEKFDLNLHEAVAHEEHEGFETDQIFEEVAPGYLLADKVLMPAKVKVTK